MTTMIETGSLFCKASAGTWRTVGKATVLQNLFTLENAAASVVAVKVTKLQVAADMTVALTAVTPAVRLSKPDVLPTGGTTLTKVLAHAGSASNADVVARGATGSDGGALSGPVANANAAHGWQVFLPRLHTAVGYVGFFYQDLLGNDEFWLQAGESLLVQVIASVGTSNPATNHYLVSCAWEEWVPFN